MPEAAPFVTKLAAARDCRFNPTDARRPEKPMQSRLEARRGTEDRGGGGYNNQASGRGGIEWGAQWSNKRPMKESRSGQVPKPLP